MRYELTFSPSDNEHAPDEPIPLSMECDTIKSINNHQSINSLSGSMK